MRSPLVHVKMSNELELFCFVMSCSLCLLELVERILSCSSWVAMCLVIALGETCWCANGEKAKCDGEYTGTDGSGKDLHLTNGQSSSPKQPGCWCMTPRLRLDAMLLR